MSKRRLLSLTAIVGLSILVEAVGVWAFSLGAPAQAASAGSQQAEKEIPPHAFAAIQPVTQRVDPVYPAVALEQHIQGTVRFEALIGKDGHIERLRLVSGHPLLVQAAREAAQDWIYRPTLLHGKPVRVVTEIKVQFQLDSRGDPVKKDNGKSSRTDAVIQ